MAEPKTPSRPTAPKHNDPGFPPLRDLDHLGDGVGGEGDDDDLDADFHDDGGGD